MTLYKNILFYDMGHVQHVNSQGFLCDLFLFLT